MNWNCPLCRTSLDVIAGDSRHGAVYRCRICKLEFVPDDRGTGLRLRPLAGETTSDRH
jgi:rubredoxin